MIEKGTTGKNLTKNKDKLGRILLNQSSHNSG